MCKINLYEIFIKISLDFEGVILGYPKVSNFFSTSGTKSQTGKNPPIVEIFISFMLCTKKNVVFNSSRRNLQINQPLGAILDTGKVKLLIGLNA